MSTPYERKAVYGTRRWKRLRAAVLHDAGYLCQCPDCFSDGQRTRTVGAELVHHKRPWQSGATWKEKEKLAFDPGNCIAVSRDCHAAIHAAEKPPERRDWQELVDALVTS